MDARPTIRIRFADFWPGFDPRDNWFTRLLGRRYRLEFVERPDFLVYSCFGGRRPEHLRHDGVRIFFTGENRRPDWRTADWAFTFDHTAHPRHFRLPLWATYADPRRLVKGEVDAARILGGKTKFCAFLASNPLCRTRNRFFRALAKRARVDSGGAVLNNLGARVGDKLSFLRPYRFTIAFENTSRAGYTTEKVMEPMLVDTIPIYWGDPLVGRDFDTRSFFSAHDGGSLDDLIERVLEVDRDPARHLAMLRHPWLVGNRVPACADPERILDRFATIFETPIAPVARRRGLARALGLHRVPARWSDFRVRLDRRIRKLTRDA